MGVKGDPGLKDPPPYVIGLKCKRNRNVKEKESSHEDMMSNSGTLQKTEQNSFDRSLDNIRYDARKSMIKINKILES